MAFKEWLDKDGSRLGWLDVEGGVFNVRFDRRHDLDSVHRGYPIPWRVLDSLWAQGIASIVFDFYEDGGLVSRVEVQCGALEAAVGRRMAGGVVFVGYDTIQSVAKRHILRPPIGTCR